MSLVGVFKRFVATKQGRAEASRREREIAEFVADNQRELESFAVLQTMAKVLQEKRALRRKGRLEWHKYEFDDEVLREIYSTCVRYMPVRKFWNDFLASVVDDIGRHRFNEQPSVNGLSREDMAVPRGGHSEHTEMIVKRNSMLRAISLAEHTLNVVRVLDSYFKGEEGSKLDFEERGILTLACLLHDYGKSMRLCARYGYIEHEEDVEGVNRVGHAICSARFITDRFKESFNQNGECMFYEDVIERVSLIVAEHHNKEYTDPLTECLHWCDRVARAGEFEILEYHNGNKEERDAAE